MKILHIVRQLQRMKNLQIYINILSSFYTRYLTFVSSHISEIQPIKVSFFDSSDWKQMALKANKIKQIPQTNKDLAFGYLRENEQKSRANYPQLIKYLILLYSNRQDHFDPNATHKQIEIEGNTITGRWNKRAHSFLKNIVIEGIHIWKFRYHQDLDDDFEWPEGCVGIWKTKSGVPDVGGTPIDGPYESKICTGYIITMDGYRTDATDPGTYSQHKFRPEVKDGDIIEMILDFNKLILTFKINDEIKAKIDGIENTAYRAAVATFEYGEGFTLLSYQDFYK